MSSSVMSGCAVGGVIGLRGEEFCVVSSSIYSCLATPPENLTLSCVT